MNLTTTDPQLTEAFIKTLETLAWNIFPTIGRTVKEEDSKKYLVNRFDGTDYHTLTPLRFAETTHDVEQNIYWLPDPRQSGYDPVYINLIQTQMDASGLTQDENFSPTVIEESG